MFIIIPFITSSNYYQSNLSNKSTKPKIPLPKNDSTQNFCEFINNGYSNEKYCPDAQTKL